MDGGVKISIVGAGSGQFSLGIVRDLCLTEGLWGSGVSFMDINGERLNAVHEVARRFAAELGVPLRFEKTLDRRESLRGADFVINSAMVVPWTGRQETQAVARKYGYGGGLGLVNFHQLKLFQEIIGDMEELCPAAWYIQSANPVFEGCTMVTRTSRIKTVGLCHGFHGGVRHIATVLGLEPEAVEAQAYGVNHRIWLTKLTYRGGDAYPLLDEWITTKAAACWASEAWPPSDEMGPKAVDVYKRLGLFPVGDTATPGGGSYFRWYHADAETQRRWREDPVAWFARYIGKVSEQAAALARVAADPDVRVTEVFPAERTQETNVSIIEAIVKDRPAVFQVNIPNEGAIPGIAGDVVVEIPALVSAAGIQGLRVGDLPKRIMCHVQENIVQMERTLEAFLSRDKEALLELLLSHPLTRTIDQARGAMEELLALPGNEALAAHFR